MRKPKVQISGKPLIISAGAQARFTSEIAHYVSHMVQEVNDKIAALYRSEASQSHIQALNGDDETGQDASVGSQARILTNAFKKKFDALFGSLSVTLAQNMVADVNNNSKQQIKASADEINRKNEAAKLTLSPAQLDPATIEILKASVASATSFIQSIPEQYINKVTDAVMNSIQTGNGLQDLEPFLEKQGSTVRNWAHNTAMDQTRKTFNNLNRGRMKKIGVKRGTWLHSGGSQHPRPLHEDFDGKVFNLDEGAPVGDDGGNYVQAGEEPNCFPGNSEIPFAGFINKGFRRWYDGEMTVAFVSSGETLTATPNHPVLTQRGWLPMKQLQVGDYLVHIADKRFLGSEENQNNCIPTIAEIFGTLEKSSVIDTLQLAETNFHGDGAKGNVDIVDAALSLQIGINTNVDKSAANLNFAETNHSAVKPSLSRTGALFLCLERVFAVPSSSVGSSNIKVGVWLGKSDDISLRAIPQSYIQLFRDCSSGNLQTLRDIEKAFAVKITLSSIVNIEHSNRSTAHVYNLQTDSGIYTVGGFVVHNCRCTFTPVIDDLFSSDDEDRQDAD